MHKAEEEEIEEQEDEKKAKKTEEKVEERLRKSKWASSKTPWAITIPLVALTIDLKEKNFLKIVIN